MSEEFVRSKSPSGRRRRIVIILASFAVFIVVYKITFMLTRESQLRRACKRADRIVVNLNVNPGFSDSQSQIPPLPTYEIVGREHVESFFDAVDFKLDALSYMCACHGSMLFEFYESDRKEPVAIVSNHHGENFYWRNSPWAGHASLTSAAKSRLAEWLADHDCPTADEAERIAADGWAKHREQD